MHLPSPCWSEVFNKFSHSRLPMNSLDFFCGGIHFLWRDPITHFKHNTRKYIRTSLDHIVRSQT